MAADLIFGLAMRALMVDCKEGCMAFLKHCQATAPIAIARVVGRVSRRDDRDAGVLVLVVLLVQPGLGYVHDGRALHTPLHRRAHESHDLKLT